MYFRLRVCAGSCLEIAEWKVFGSNFSSRVHLPHVVPDRAQSSTSTYHARGQNVQKVESPQVYTGLRRSTAMVHFDRVSSPTTRRGGILFFFKTKKLSFYKWSQFQVEFERPRPPLSAPSHLHLCFARPRLSGNSGRRLWTILIDRSCASSQHRASPASARQRDRQSGQDCGLCVECGDSSGLP